MDVKRLALIGGLGVAAFVGFLQLQKLTAPAPAAPQQARQAPAPKVAQVKYVDILAAEIDISMGTRVTSEMMGWQKWPEEANTEGFILRSVEPEAMESLIASVAKTTIYAGEPIVHRKIVRSGERGQMAALLKPGMRAVATPISAETAAGGFIKPGDRVDVVLTGRPKRMTGAVNEPDYVAVTIFENVHVLAIDSTYGHAQDGTAYVLGSTALLELSQEDAEALALAENKGELSLTLRGLDRRRPAFIPSAAAGKKEQGDNQVTSLKVYRNGQPQQVAIQGN